MSEHTVTDEHPQRPLVLLPGYWLGGWAWDEVLRSLTERGHPAEAVTLPGLDPADTARDRVRFADHVRHVIERLDAQPGPSVLVAHSGSGAVATAVADAVPDRLARIVYVDSGPCADGWVPVPDLPNEAVEVPFPGLDALAADGASTEGIEGPQRDGFEQRAVPQPAGACREPIRLTDPRRNAVPATLVCCSLGSDTIRELADQGAPMFAAVNDLTDRTWIDLPTGHWPMFSRPADLARILSDEATRS